MSLMVFYHIRRTSVRLNFKIPILFYTVVGVLYFGFNIQYVNERLIKSKEKSKKFKVSYTIVKVLFALSLYLLTPTVQARLIL